MTPNQAQQQITTLIAQIKEHPMCLRFADIEGAYRVYHPAGFFTNATQASYGEGKIVALQRLLSSIENQWMRAYPNFGGLKRK